MEKTDGVTENERKSLEILAYFFFSINKIDSADRAVKALLALDPKDLWAQGMHIMCADAKEDFSLVEKLTENLDKFFNADDLSVYNSLTLLRARALHKLGRSDEAKDLINTVIKE